MSVPRAPLIGVFVFSHHTTYRVMRESWLRAEEMGFDTYYTHDHFYPYHGDPAGPNLECWTLMAAIAESTERIRFGPMVTGNSYRHPAVLAKIAATVDHISDGRLILGIGAGWMQAEYDAYGISFGTAAERLRALEESLVVLRKLLGPDPTSDFEGSVYRLANARAEPKPVQRSLPIAVGGKGEKVTLRLAAQYADDWHYWGTVEEWRHLNQTLDAWCDRLGRDRSAVMRTVMLADQKHWDRAEEYVAAGAQELVLVGEDPVPWGAMEAVLRRFGR